MIELIFCIIIGIFIGVLTGLIPGLHTNLFSSALILYMPLIASKFSSIEIIFFIVSMAITNSFLEFIPSIYLGAPNEDTVLSILPGHELLMKGEGHYAFKLGATGALVGVFLFVPFTIIFFVFLKNFYEKIELMIPFFLFWISVILVIENKQKILAFIFFVLSGFLGIASSNLSLNQSLLPLLTGLFGTSGLIYSIKENTQIPPQKNNISRVKTELIKKPIIASILIAPICSILPGIGTSQATIIGAKINNQNREQFLISNGIMAILTMSLSFTTLFLIDKSRTGSAAALAEIGIISLKEFIFLGSILISIGIIMFFISQKISLIFSKIISNLNYKKISLTVLFFLVAINFFIVGKTGLLVLAVATLLGLLCQESGVRKGILMGCLIIPTILFYLPFF
jgi:putative membrane protein